MGQKINQNGAIWKLKLASQLWKADEVVLKGKCMDLNASIRKAKAETKHPT